jgi:hypothetical protein
VKKASQEKRYAYVCISNTAAQHIHTGWYKLAGGARAQNGRPRGVHSSCVCIPNMAAQHMQTERHIRAEEQKMLENLKAIAKRTQRKGTLLK